MPSESPELREIRRRRAATAGAAPVELDAEPEPSNHSLGPQADAPDPDAPIDLLVEFRKIALDPKASPKQRGDALREIERLENERGARAASTAELLAGVLADLAAMHTATPIEDFLAGWNEIALERGYRVLLERIDGAESVAELPPYVELVAVSPDDVYLPEEPEEIDREQVKDALPEADGLAPAPAPSKKVMRWPVPEGTDPYAGVTETVPGQGSGSGVAAGRTPDYGGSELGPRLCESHVAGTRRGAHDGRNAQEARGVGRAKARGRSLKDEEPPGKAAPPTSPRREYPMTKFTRIEAQSNER